VGVLIILLLKPPTRGSDRLVKQVAVATTVITFVISLLVLTNPRLLDSVRRLSRCEAAVQFQ